MAWTTPKDIKDRWLESRALPPDDKLIVFINDVEEQISDYFPRIQERIEDDRLKLSTIKSNVSRILIEFLQTGGSPYQQESQAYSGIGSRSVSIASTSRRSLVLTADDLAAFAPKDEGGDVVSIRMEYDRPMTRSADPFYWGGLHA